MINANWINEARQYLRAADNILNSQADVETDPVSAWGFILAAKKYMPEALNELERHLECQK